MQKRGRVRKSENMMKSHTHLFIYVTVSLQFRACFSRKISKYQQWRDIFVPCIDRLFLNNRNIIIHSFYSNTFFKDLKISVLCDLPVKLLSDKLDVFYVHPNGNSIGYDSLSSLILAL